MNDQTFGDDDGISHGEYPDLTGRLAEYGDVLRGITDEADRRSAASGRNASSVVHLPTPVSSERRISRSRIVVAIAAASLLSLGLFNLAGSRVGLDDVETTYEATDRLAAPTSNGNAASDEARNARSLDADGSDSADDADETPTAADIAENDDIDDTKALDTVDGTDLRTQDPSSWIPSVPTPTSPTISSPASDVRGTRIRPRSTPTARSKPAATSAAQGLTLSTTTPTPSSIPTSTPDDATTIGATATPTAETTVGTPTATATPTESPTVAITPTATTSAASTPTPSPTATESQTAAITVTATPTFATPTITATPSVWPPYYLEVWISGDIVLPAGSTAAGADSWRVTIIDATDGSQFGLGYGGVLDPGATQIPFEARYNEGALLPGHVYRASAEVLAADGTVLFSSNLGVQITVGFPINGVVIPVSVAP